MSEHEIIDVEAVETVVEEMPRPRFSVETSLDVSLHEEANKAMASRGGRVLFAVCLAMLASYLGISVWQLIVTRSTSAWLSIAVCLLAGGLLIYSRLFGQKRALQKWEAQIQAAFGTNALHLTTEFYDLVLTQIIRESGDSVECGYSSLRGLRETEHLLLLQNTSGNYFFVDKRCVRGGTPEELRAFLESMIGGK